MLDWQRYGDCKALRLAEEQRRLEAIEIGDSAEERGALHSRHTKARLAVLTGGRK